MMWTFAACVPLAAVLGFALGYKFGRQSAYDEGYGDGDADYPVWHAGKPNGHLIPKPERESSP